LALDPPEAHMAQSFLMLLVCQALGELIHRLTGLPLSGPISGMVLLLGAMLIRGGPSAQLRASSGSLLSYLSLLFVPAAVGVMPYLPLLRSQWLPIAVALLVSTVLAMGSAALIVQAINRCGTDSLIRLAVREAGDGK
jgi:holin-like protein